MDGTDFNLSFTSFDGGDAESPESKASILLVGEPQEKAKGM
jgi:hypothetical protein